MKKLDVVRSLKLQQAGLTAKIASRVAAVAIASIATLPLFAQAEARHAVENEIRSRFPALVLDSPAALERALESVNGRSITGVRPRAHAPASTAAQAGVQIFYPDSYDEPVVATLGEQRVALRPAGSAATPAAVSQGKIVYTAAYDVTDILQVPRAGGSEELLYLRDSSAPKVFDYEIVEMAGVRKIALVNGAAIFEGNDSATTTGAAQFVAAKPFLQVDKPWVIDANGRRSETAARWTLVEREGAPTTLRLTIVDDSLVYPLVVDPSFSAAGSMLALRNFFTATTLPSGKVLFTGGESTSGIVATAEIYDPLTGSYIATANTMSVPRASHAATMLPNGKVLLTGGRNATSTALTLAELFDPATSQFVAVTPMFNARTGHTSTLLPNGDVLIAGGDTPGGLAELYHPADGTWSTPNSAMTTARTRHTATLLPDGTVLLAGGNGTILNSAEIYNPATRNFAATGAMSTSRVYHSATVLPNGKVLVAGGAASGSSLSTAELYAPSAGTFSATIAMTTTRRHLTATLLPNGTVLLTGGVQTGGAAVATAEIYDPASGALGTFTATGSMSIARAFHNATLLPNGNVMIAGGGSATAEVYQSATGTFAQGGSMQVPRQDFTATPLPDGHVLAVGGTNGSTTLAAAELYDPVTNTFSATAPLSNPRFGHTATLLGGGIVLIAGGDETGSWEGYWLSSHGFGSNGLMPPRIHHTATLLKNGLVLFAGGETYNHVTNSYTPLATADLFDPTTGIVRSTGAMTSTHKGHSATLLIDGRVLIAGAGTPEIYDPAAGTFSLVPSLSQRYWPATANLLSDGKVLISGYSNPEDFTELFDPVAGAGPSTSSTQRTEPTATLLANGQVFVEGPYFGAPVTPQLYDPATRLFTTTAAGQPSGGHRAVLLSNGKVLLAGGHDLGGTPSSSSLLYDVGLAFADNRRPVVASATTALCQPGNIALAGSSFRSDSEGGTGGIDSSPGNSPLLRLQRIDNNQLLFIAPQLFSDTSFYSVPVSGLAAGSYRASILSNGIPSLERTIDIAMAPQTATYAAASANVSGSAIVPPASLPSGFTGSLYPLVASAPGFTGSLGVNGATGAVNVTNAGPVGDYTVTVFAGNACGAVSTTFPLQVIGPASALTATGGTPQSASLNAAFQLPLQATVKDSVGHPLNNVTVIFSVPGAGATATLSAGSAQSNASGIASVTATANGTAGNYNVQAIVGGLTANFALSNTTAPANVVAAAVTSSSVSITWTALGGVTYEVQRQAAGGVIVSLGTTAGGALTDNSATAATAYLYSVRTVTPSVSAFSPPDLATTVIFDDPTLTAGATTVKAAHFTQLRTAADAVRALAGLGAFAYTDATLTPGVTAMKAAHLTDLRTALAEARTALFLPTISYSRPTITAGSTTVAAADLNELRTGVR